MSGDPKPKVTLEDLLRLKRAERPAPEFWARFDRELRAKQLAALVEKRPWWQGLPEWALNWRLFHLPLGATAVLALPDVKNGFAVQGLDIAQGSPAAFADFIVAENSRSMSTTLASQWSSMKATVAASSRVLMACSTAPVIGTPKCASYISGMLGAMIATVSPVPMPWRSSAEADRKSVV